MKKYLGFAAVSVFLLSCADYNTERDNPYDERAYNFIGKSSAEGSSSGVEVGDYPSSSSGNEELSSSSSLPSGAVLCEYSGICSLVSAEVCAAIDGIAVQSCPVSSSSSSIVVSSSSVAAISSSSVPSSSSSVVPSSSSAPPSSSSEAESSSSIAPSSSSAVPSSSSRASSSSSARSSSSSVAPSSSSRAASSNSDGGNNNNSGGRGPCKDPNKGNNQNLYCGFSHGCFEIQNNYSDQGSECSNNSSAKGCEPCPDKIAACEEAGGGLFVGVRAAALNENNSYGFGVDCKAEGGTQVGGREDCGNNYCKWSNISCEKIVTDPDGMYGPATANCNEAIANCKSDGKLFSSMSACNNG